MSGSTSLVDNLVRSASEHADRCAIQDGANGVTYAQLLHQARGFAAHLRAAGLRGGDRVAIVLPNCSDFVAGYYGILIAGGVAVLLNAAAKERDFAAWLRDSEAAFVLCEERNAEVKKACASLDPKPLLLHALGPPSDDATAAEADPNAPACMLYTSGTTGHPKGVVLSHGNLLSNTASIVEYLGLAADDSIVTILPFYYSYGSSVLHTHLQVGGRIVLEKNLVYPHAVVETLAKERATGFAGVPSTFSLLVSRVKLQDYDLSALRYVTQAGGGMAPALTQRLCDLLPHVNVVVMYGQTEATARLTYLPPDKLKSKLGSVGIPIPGVTIEVRKEDGTPAPSGEVGEVWARGRNIMLGYWRNDAATREVLRAGWLKTGDMGHLDDEGFLYLVGRRSDMIKAGAHRIHPQDIEDVVLELTEVQEAAAVGVDDDVLGQAIKVFVVPAAGSTLTPMKIQAHCRERLANYKVPKFVEFVSGLPRTASGKIRRAELQQRTTSEHST